MIPQWTNYTELRCALRDLPYQHRKLCLFSCACVREIWHLLYDERSKKAIEAVEAFVDALIDRPSMLDAASAAKAAAAAAIVSTKAAYAAAAASNAAYAAYAASAVYAAEAFHAADASNAAAAIAAASNAAKAAAAYAAYAAYASADAYATARRHMYKRQHELLKEIYNPCEIVVPVHVKEFALTFYETREDLQILADFAEEHGITDIQILQHLREHCKHPKGCWALEALCEKR